MQRLELVERYLDVVEALVRDFRNGQREAIGRAAQCVARALRGGGVVHLFGTGHSHMLAEEVFFRAGGLAPIDAMLDERVVLSGGAMRSAEAERTPGVAAAIASRYDLRPCDVGVVISHSGRNAAPVEMALLMRERGIPVIGVTSLAHSKALPPLRPPGARLYEVADFVIDTGCPYGDAAVRGPGLAYPTGATSTIVGAVAVQCVILGAIEMLVEEGEAVVNLPSANIEHGEAVGAAMREFAKFRGRIRHL